MKSSKKTLIALSFTAIICSACAVAATRYPNLDDAVGSLNSAIDHIHLAQKNHGSGHFGGHAERALRLIEDAKAELREAETK